MVLGGLESGTGLEGYRGLEAEGSRAGQKMDGWRADWRVEGKAGGLEAGMRDWAEGLGWRVGGWRATLSRSSTMQEFRAGLLV